MLLTILFIKNGLAIFESLLQRTSHNFSYNFDKFHGLLNREGNFNRVLDGMVTVSK